MWPDFGGPLTLPDGVAIMANLANAVPTHTQLALALPAHLNPFSYPGP